ncbi:MAG: DUF354 domain-containing protein [Myxococcota bacterium]|nr:DUF354 domain-containing protein [Myxococcota bacterium]
MRLLFDVLHPAHVHFFRPLAEEVRAGGGEVLFAARRKEVAVELLQAYDLPFRELSAIGGGPLGLAGELATRSARLASLCREFRPDALLGIMGPCIAPVGRLLGIPSLVCYDTETAGVTNRWVFPLATAVLTPRAWRGRPRRNQRQYDGTQELAYLHPRRFTPDPSRLVRAGLTPGEPFALVRFVSWEASHDLGDRGFVDREGFVRALAARTKTVISSERGVPASLADRVLDLPPADLHHALAAASLVVGEGATTAAEAAVLGTPAVFVHTARLGYMDELENRFGLLYRRTRQDEALRLSLDLLADPAQTAATWARRRQRLLESSVDVTDWLTATVADVVGSRSAE